MQIVPISPREQNDVLSFVKDGCQMCSDVLVLGDTLLQNNEVADLLLSVFRSAPIFRKKALYSHNFDLKSSVFDIQLGLEYHTSDALMPSSVTKYLGDIVTFWT